MQPDSEALTLEQALSALRRRLPLILLCVVLAGAAAYGLSKRQTKKYTATASLSFNSSPLTQEIAGLPATGSSGSALLAQQANNLELVRLGDTAAKTASRLRHGLTAEKVSSSVSVESHGESSVVTVTATAKSATLAAAIANTYTHEFVQEQRRASKQYLKSALAAVMRQLGELSPKQRTGGDGVQLQNRAQTLRLLTELNYSTVQIGQEASAPASPSSPKTSRNTVLGIVLGLLLGLGLTVVFERLDRRMRRPRDLEAIYRLPLVGAIPKSAALRRSKRIAKPLPLEEAEAFRLIRAQLRLMSRGDGLRTLAIAAAGTSEGTTTIAFHIANTSAALGAKVLLLEGDLRRPTVARKLDIEASPGLTDILTRSCPMSEAIQRVPVSPAFGQQGVGRTLDVIVAGTGAGDPVELLEGRAMDATLAGLHSDYDLVVIDTTPLTIVADAISILTKVDGVMVVGRIGRGSRGNAEQLSRMLSSSGANLLGVLANGTKLTVGRTGAVPSDTPAHATAVATSVNGGSSTDLLSTVKS